MRKLTWEVTILNKARCEVCKGAFGLTRHRFAAKAILLYGDTVTSRIGAVVFAAPDIDMDVFSSAISRIGPLAGKITVITSTNDRALALSGEIARGMTRVGAAEKAAIERLGCA